MKKNSKILCMGPIAPPYSGQSVSFTLVTNAIKRRRKCIIINISKKDNVLSGILLSLTIIYRICFSKIEAIYFTCSRSFAGSLRDIILLSCARLKKIRVINHLHGTDFKTFYSQLPLIYKRIIHRCYLGVNTSIVLIDGMEREFEDFKSMKKVIVANCYSSSLDALPVVKQKYTDDIQILYLSNIMHSKGIIFLLKACDIIFSEFKDVNLKIAGAPLGDTYSTKKEIAKEFSLLFGNLKVKYPSRISYLGVSKGEQKNKLLWDSDVFILPTFYKTEAFPISILEAMRSGNYIISSFHKYIPQIVNSNIGTLIEPKSTQAIVDVLEYLLNNISEVRSIQNYNIKHAIKNYNEEIHVETLSKIILE